jgi:hypothetical protein
LLTISNTGVCFFSAVCRISVPNVSYVYRDNRSTVSTSWPQQQLRMAVQDSNLERIPILNLDPNCCGSLSAKLLGPRGRQRQSSSGEWASFSGVNFHDVAAAFESALGSVLAQWVGGRCTKSLPTPPPASGTAGSSLTRDRSPENVSKKAVDARGRASTAPLDTVRPAGAKHRAVVLSQTAKNKWQQVRIPAQVLCNAALRTVCAKERGWTSDQIMRRVAERRWLEETMREYALKHQRLKSRSSRHTSDDFLHMKSASVLPNSLLQSTISHFAAPCYPRGTILAAS